MSSNNDIRKKVDDLYATIKDAEKCLEDIRKECPHKSTHIGEYAWAPGHHDVALLCYVCDAFIRQATTAEMSQYFKDVDVKYAVVQHTEFNN